MKKILFIAPLPPPVTGQANANNKIIEQLSNEFEFDIINYSKNSFKQGINSIKRVIEVFSIIDKVRKRKKNKDLVYLNLSQSIAGNIKDLIIIYICRNVDIIVHLHGGGLHEKVFKFKILKKLNNLMYKKVNKVIVLGPSLKRIFDGVVDDEKLVIVKNYYDNQLNINDDMFYEKYVQDPLNIIYISNLLPGKGYLELVSAAIKLSKDYNNLKFYFAGNFIDNKEKLQFKKSIEKYQNIKYLGSICGEEKEKIFKKAQIFCLPTYYKFFEGQPISILEAYGAGCCVLTTKHGGIFDVFKPGFNGLELEKESIDSIVSNIKILEKDRALLKMMAKNNKDVSKRYREEVYIERISYIFKNC